MMLLERLSARIGFDVRFPALMMVLHQLRDEVQECVDSPPMAITTPAEAYRHVVWVLDRILTVTSKSVYAFEAKRLTGDARRPMGVREHAEKSK